MDISPEQKQWNHGIIFKKVELSFKKISSSVEIGKYFQLCLTLNSGELIEVTSEGEPGLVIPGPILHGDQGS